MARRCGLAHAQAIRSQSLGAQVCLQVGQLPRYVPFSQVTKLSRRLETLETSYSEFHAPLTCSGKRNVMVHCKHARINVMLMRRCTRRSRAMNAPQHDNFVDQLARPARSGQDRITKSYALASRILGDLSLLIQQEPQNVVQVNLWWIP
jgi:hypothetical protein